MMKLVLTEFSEGTIQLTYTDGQPVPEAAEYLIVRLPIQGSSKDSLDFHQMNILERLHVWAKDEYERVKRANRGN